MTEKEVKKLLKKANEERLFGETTEALAILHHLHDAFPNDITYIGLLASTYYEQKEYDAAVDYCDKADAIDLNNPNTLDLRGVMAYEKGITKYTDRWLNHYNMSEKYIASKKKDVEQGYILNPNFDNYETDEKGRFL